jgi:hypothetical protein
MQLRLAWNLSSSYMLWLLSAGITGMYHQAWTLNLLFCWNLDLNSGLHASKGDAVPPKPHLQSILLWLFWRWGSCPDWPQTKTLLISATQAPSITRMSHQYLTETLDKSIQVQIWFQGLQVFKIFEKDIIRPLMQSAWLHSMSGSLIRRKIFA